eukprot:GHVH01006107.1.p1 GENE.GHVH01006107.1~~GHVH01006107.1.p1  ORF type:complete len:220 (+),score=27.18 GHVH01006107.1:164-823(+)
MVDYSYEYSYEYTDNEAGDDDSEDQPLVKATPKKKTAPKKNTVRQNAADKKTRAEACSSPVNHHDSRPPTRENRSAKEDAVSALLCRWWFVLPPWPPVDWNYKEQLEMNKMKVVSLREWPDLDDVDENGYKKCYELDHIEGFYRIANGDLIDLRPVDGMPSHDGLMKCDYPEICEMLVIALQNQLEELKLSNYRNTDVRIWWCDLREVLHSFRGSIELS